MDIYSLGSTPVLPLPLAFRPTVPRHSSSPSPTTSTYLFCDILCPRSNPSLLLQSMPGLVSDATRIWELNVYWLLGSQCGVWDSKTKGVDVWECIRPRTSLSFILCPSLAVSGSLADTRPLMSLRRRRIPVLCASQPTLLAICHAPMTGHGYLLQLPARLISVTAQLTSSG